jgi:hypothetical protein
MTKTIAIALAAVIGTASLATADSYLAIDNSAEAQSFLTLDNVTSDGVGTVEIFDYHNGEIGDLLGTEDVALGANRDVRINFGKTPTRDVIAVLTVNGQVVEQEEIELR